jgi:hypothetical protein
MSALCVRAGAAFSPLCFLTADYFDKDTNQELDPIKKAIEQTTTRNAQAAAAGAGH